MAIIVEEEKKQTGGWAAAGWSVVAVIVIAAGYYLFLASPEAATVTPPADIAAFSSLSQISLTPQDVAGLPAVKAFNPSILSVASSGPATVGRANPFVAP